MVAATFRLRKGEAVRREMLEILKDKKALKDAGMFIVDTEKILGEAIAAGFQIKYFFYSEKGGWVYDKHGSGIDFEKVDFTKDSYIDRFASVKTHQGFLAVVQVENRAITDLAAMDKAVLLDNIQDPANVGAILRSGCAFGFTNYLLINSASIYSEKTIRASAGAAFQVFTRAVEEKDIKDLKGQFKIAATDVKIGVDVASLKKELSGKYILILSNEGQGISPGLGKIADVRVKINYPGKVESLNVAAAAAIMFYELGK